MRKPDSSTLGGGGRQVGSQQRAVLRREGRGRARGRGVRVRRSHARHILCVLLCGASRDQELFEFTLKRNGR